jgi:hypothetical protein
MTNDLQAELAALKAENRTLRVGGGATFEELEASGKAGGGPRLPIPRIAVSSATEQ